MTRQTKGFAASIGIHGLLCLAFLLVAAVPPKTRQIALDFSITSSASAGQPQAAPTVKKRRPVPKRKRQEPRTVTPVVKDERAVPVKQDLKEEIPAPSEQQSFAEAETTDDADPSLDADGGVDGSGGADDADPGGRYVEAQFIYIRDKIFRNLSYPLVARKMGWTGKVTVAFTVCPDGSVEELAVVESSGHTVLDRSAMDAVEKSCPLPKPPVRAALTMPVVYRLE